MTEAHAGCMLVLDQVARAIDAGDYTEARDLIDAALTPEHAEAHYRSEVERMRAGWDTDVDWANKLLLERDRFREALQQIADTTPNSRPGWVHWAEQARRALERA